MHTPATSLRRLCGALGRLAAATRAVTLGLTALLAFGLQAGLSEPDAVLFGTLTVNGRTATAADTQLRVEARRTLTGPPLAAYTMGSQPEAGDFYVLRVGMEAALPLADPNSVLPGDPLVLVLLDAGVIRGQANATIAGRGEAQRIDVTAGVPDSDGDSLPDPWETAHFGGLTRGPGFISPNGLTALQNFVAGTNPNDPASQPEVEILQTQGLLSVRFPAWRAEGTGYEGRSRFYTLQVSTDLGGPWTSVSGYVRLLGGNQLITYQPPYTNSAAFYQTRIELEP